MAYVTTPIFTICVTLLYESLTNMTSYIKRTNFDKIRRKGRITIGATKIDVNAKERSLEARYPALDSPANLRILLSDYHALLNRQYQGDYDAVVLLVDLRKAIDTAQLTGRQSEALRLVYEEDLTQEEAGNTKLLN
jgi:DNA-directed RNA polymerase specialized sigma24 family protein